VAVGAFVPGAAQHFFSDALQTRDHSRLGVWNDPGSAVQRCALHRVREKFQELAASLVPGAAQHFHSALKARVSAL
jgi:hypothetical protein